MKEELLKMLKPLIDKGTDGIFKLADLIQQQAPDLVNEIYRWEFTFSFSLAMLFFLAILALSICLWILCVKLDDDDKVFLIFFVIPLVPSIAFFITFLLASIKVLIAPKLFLFDYILYLIK